MKKSILALSIISLFSGAANAAPGAGNFVVGSGSINGGTNTNVNITAAGTNTKGSNVSVVNWNGFNVNTNESVNFNNLTGNKLTSVNIDQAGVQSVINGSISTTGDATNIVLINPNGVSIGDTASISTGNGVFLAVGGNAAVNIDDPDSVSIDVNLTDAAITVSKLAAFEGNTGQDQAMLDIKLNVDSSTTDSASLPFVFNNVDTVNSDLAVTTNGVDIHADGMPILNGKIDVSDTHKLTFDNYTTSNNNKKSEIVVGNNAAVILNNVHDAKLDQSENIINSSVFTINGNISNSDLSMSSDTASTDVSINDSEISNSKINIIGSDYSSLNANNVTNSSDSTVNVTRNGAKNIVSGYAMIGGDLTNNGKLYVSSTQDSLLNGAVINNGELFVSAENIASIGNNIGGNGDANISSIGSVNITSLFDKTEISQEKLTITADQASISSNLNVPTLSIITKNGGAFTQNTVIADNIDINGNLQLGQNSTTANNIIVSGDLSVINSTLNADIVSSSGNVVNISDSIINADQILFLTDGNQTYFDSNLNANDIQIMSKGSITFSNATINNTTNDGAVKIIYGYAYADNLSSLTAKEYFISDGGYVLMTKSGRQIADNTTTGAGVTLIKAASMGITNSKFNNGQPEPEAPVVTPEPEAPVVTPEPEAPVVTPEPEAPVVTPEPEAPVVTPEPEAPVVTPEPEAPVVTPEPEAPVVTPEPEAPVVAVPTAPALNAVNFRVDNTKTETETHGSTVVLAGNASNESDLITFTERDSDQ